MNSLPIDVNILHVYSVSDLPERLKDRQNKGQHNVYIHKELDTF